MIIISIKYGSIYIYMIKIMYAWYSIYSSIRCQTIKSITF